MERHRRTRFLRPRKTEPRCTRCPAAACAACPVSWPSTARLLSLLGSLLRSTSIFVLVFFLFACGASVAGAASLPYVWLAQPWMSIFVYYMRNHQRIALPGIGEFSLFYGWDVLLCLLCLRMMVVGGELVWLAMLYGMAKQEGRWSCKLFVCRWSVKRLWARDSRSTCIVFVGGT